MIELHGERLIIGVDAAEDVGHRPEVIVDTARVDRGGDGASCERTSIDGVSNRCWRIHRLYGAYERRSSPSDVRIHKSREFAPEASQITERHHRVPAEVLLEGQIGLMNLGSLEMRIEELDRRLGCGSSGQHRRVIGRRWDHLWESRGSRCGCAE